MNKILHLFDEKYVLDLFRKEVLPLYPTFIDISQVVIKPYKKMVWTETYHAVISFDTYFINSKGEETKIPIVCSAHSDEERKNVFEALKYVRANYFTKSGFDLPRPLFYSDYFRGTFYRAIGGENLLHYIKLKETETVEEIVALAAKLFAKLHQIPAGAEANFNPLNSRIETVIPGVSNILKEMEARYPGLYTDDLKNIYNYFVSSENKFFAGHKKLSLIHGDAHAENIIKTGEGRIGLIDFTDLCLGDFARDIGTFMQQLEYKVTTKAGDTTWAEKLKKLFLETYLETTGREMTADLRERIELYYNFTAIRTTVYLFLKYENDSKNGKALLEKVKANLNLK